MKPEDIVHLRAVGCPSLSRDGGFVACAIRSADLAADTYRTQIWGGPVDAPALTRLTDGDSDSAPRVSPDGTRVAFLRADETGHPQIHLLHLDSGEVHAVTNHQFGVDAPVWAPDSRSLAYTAYTVVDEAASDRTTVRVVDLTFYAGSVGYTAGLASKLFVVDLSAGTTRQLTTDDSDDADPDWSPDGTHLCFVSAKHPNHRNEPGSDVWTVALSDGRIRRLTPDGMDPLFPRYAPDNGSVYFSGAPLTKEGYNDGYASFGVWAVDVAGEGTLRRVSELDYNLSYVCQTIVPHGDRIYFGADDQGRVPLVAFRGSDALGTPEVLFDGNFQVNGFAVGGDPDRPVVACVIADQGSAGDLYIVENGTRRALTRFGEELARHATLREPHPVESVAADGHRTRGWVFVPEGKGPFPVVLIVKGGPYTQFGYTMSGPGSFEEAQVLCGAGYLVVIGNPRGSSGYGQQHLEDIPERLPQVTSEDLLGLLRQALKSYPGDAARVGVMGGSFGGYMAAWLAATTTGVFRGAIGERGCYALDSYLATSDDGVNIVNALWGSDRSRWTEYSPITHVDDIDIPILLLHSDQDRHAPIEQARRLFVEMKLRGERAELLIFPGGSHELSRSGPVRQRLARYGVILDWWAELLAY